jgi:hypothetical protein
MSAYLIRRVGTSLVILISIPIFSFEASQSTSILGVTIADPQIRPS